MVSDEELYRQYLNGKEEGLDRLMQRYGNSLTLYINGYLHDLHEAEDLMIEVFAYVFTKKPHIRDGGLKAYLYKAARHMALRHKSRLHRVFCLEDLSEEPEEKILVEEVIRTKERNRILHLCMSELNQAYREVLYLVYFEDMSYRQAGEVMNKNIKQVTNLVYRGKRACGSCWNGREFQMRSNEERVVEVKRRIEQKKRKDKLQRSRMVMALAVAASLLLIVSLSAYMPGLTGQLSADSYSHYEMTASIFHNNNALSYIIVGLAAFILGVGITILGVRIHHLDKTQHSAMDKGDEEDGAD